MGPCIDHRRVRIDRGVAPTRFAGIYLMADDESRDVGLFSSQSSSTMSQRRGLRNPAPFRVHASHELRRQLTQPLVGHAPAARHVIVSKRPGLQGHFFRHALVPEGAGIGGGEQLFDHRPALPLERRQRPRHVRARFRERAVKRDGILEGEARPLADGKMHRAQRIADKHLIANRPAAVGKQRKLPPDGFIRNQ